MNQLAAHFKHLANPRASLAMMTEATKTLGALVCEACEITHPGGPARGLLVLEADQELPWTLWLLPDGWTDCDEDSKGPMAVCARCQSIPVVQGLRWEP